MPIHAANDTPVGSDVARIFAKAKDGAPLRFVAFGGSITQSGEGWIGPWLKGKFPSSHVTIINSGMSATGSELGIFRIDRDVISHQPDLVAIETCVNDGKLSDEATIRYLESLIVRLKQLPHPPAIFLIEAAAKDGSKLSRHRQVAQHYGLLEVDLQVAVEAELQRSGLEWTSLFKDNVHPADEGNRFYARTIEQALAPFLDAKLPASSSELPAPLSTQPLLLDGRMVPLFGLSNVPGWKRAASPAFWIDAFFNGTLASSDPGASLALPFRGTWVGLLYPMNRSYGSFDVRVDDAEPRRVAPNTRGGYSFEIVGHDLPPGEHLLRVTLPPSDPSTPGLNGEVRLGYLLLAGDTP